MAGRYPVNVRAEQDIAIMDLYLAGKSAREIGNQLTLGHATVERRIAKMLKAITPMEVDEHRKVIAAQLKRIIRKLDPGMDGDPSVRALTAGKLLAAIDSLKRLEGLDSPQRASVEVVNLTPEDIELRQMVAEINARAAQTTDADASA
jgi:hypothetical protein